MLESVVEEEGDVWSGHFDEDILFRPAGLDFDDGSDDGDDGASFSRLLPGQQVPQREKRYPKPQKRAAEDEDDGVYPDMIPGPSNARNDDDDNQSEFGLGRFLKRSKKN